MRLCRIGGATTARSHGLKNPRHINTRVSRREMMRAREFMTRRSASVGVGDRPTNMGQEKATARRDQPEPMVRAVGKQVGRAVATQDESAPDRPGRG